MGAHSPIPIFETLENIYGDAKGALSQGDRWNHLIEEFVRRFDHKPTHIVRAPGRVNLIGEHIDYALFGVFPAAIERDILIALGPAARDDGSIRAENLDAKYSDRQFTPIRSSSNDWELSIDKSTLSWESYVKAGYFGILNRFFAGDGVPKSANLLVTGSVPAGSGLSSSAAMVVASSLSFLVVNNLLANITKGTLVEMAMENERRVGVNSGGMDQAASVISDSGKALYITFHPTLEAEPVVIPSASDPQSNAVFVVANSMVISDKAVSAKTQYNLRVLETLVAARLLAKNLNIQTTPLERITLREVLDRFTGITDRAPTPEELQRGLLGIMEKLDCLKPVNSDREAFSMTEMIQATGLSDSMFEHVYLSWNEVESAEFHPFLRAQHVYSEALRVLRFRETCLRTEGSPDLWKQLGNFMNDSQASCKDKFDCSCKELDRLVSLCLSAGAYGSRLTGAGWGGCTVSLVAENKVPEFIAELRERYEPYHNLPPDRLGDIIFATKPGSGASVFSLSGV